ncbi:MAG TPA: Sapep family Mn(2+)-dependent dipeptidase [Candidatus Lachnoclostridium stercorigallinarum]|uniref:Sapep family Mn(2+)-dependent dipeptidase n=1 Tax=Candidatus Lachnoclostridium stercorigallinarum TaxID=2838634 RepID=A0A9D2GHQ3_9FIRM|nr:Sapep family Mn(2+)-dependent dipeptidase [Candidatus Lachnoclostridium stercorigallinarum]
MEEKILAKVDELSQEMIRTIIRMVQIDSVEAEAEPDAPFGRGVKKALDAALQLAEEMGFSAVNVDNYMGYASYGESEDYVCAVGHLDVVPVGTGWKQPPFSGYMKDGVIYSRGVLDNKGPIFSCLYALYALKELGIRPDRQIRILFGCDEETGFEDLKYYLSKEKPPVMGFTPDCKYPVVYAERGRALVEISPVSAERFYALMNDYVLNAKNNGERFHIDFKDEEFGQVEVRNFKILPAAPETAPSVPSLQFAVSYPAGCTADQIVETIRKELPDAKVSLVSNMDPVRFEKDCRLVDTLKYTYEKVTGMDGTPVTTTGGTYAKMMPNIVPFGPSFPGQKGIGHQPDEWMKVEDIITNAKIYALSLYYLSKDGEAEEK